MAKTLLCHYMWRWLFFCSLLLSQHATTATAHPLQPRTINVVNRSDRQVEVYFVTPHNNNNNNDQWKLLSEPAVSPGTSFYIHNARSGQAFVIQEEGVSQVDNNRTGLQFVASEEDGQTVTINQEWQLDRQDDKTKAQQKARQMLEDCKAQQLSDNNHSTSATIDNTLLQNCVQQKLQASIEQTREDTRYHTRVRKHVLADHWEHFACEDSTLETSDPLYRKRWYNEREDDTYNVAVLHDYKSSQIHLVEQFIDPHECQAILEYSAPTLHRAMVHDGHGGNHFSDHRKAWQAGVKVPWHLPHHPIAQLSRRVYEYTNHVLGLNLRQEGQEDLMSIQYFGTTNNDDNEEDEPPDRYMPHCDGECMGRQHKRGNRMATMVMYCEVPTVGGHTNFRNAGVHVQPTVGSAAFFSYIDPTTNITDHGYTSHSGCPVYEGSKKIVTQWIRLGVDEDNPHDSFNTLGVQDEHYWDSDDDEEEVDSEDEQEGVPVEEEVETLLELTLQQREGARGHGREHRHPKTPLQGDKVVRGKPLHPDNRLLKRLK